MHNCNLPVSLLDSKQGKDLCPYLNLPHNFVAAVEEEAGILAASKAVTALQVMSTMVNYLKREYGCSIGIDMKIYGFQT